MTQLIDCMVGVDLGDRESVFCRINRTTGECQEGSFKMTQEAVREQFEPWARSPVVFEVGTHSRWMRRVLSEMGFVVSVVDPRRLALITRSHRKNDRNDAIKLARLALADLDLLNPVDHRDDVMQADLSVALSRNLVVEIRTKVINHVRGSVKSMGERLRTCDTRCFKKEREAVPEILRPAHDPLFELLEKADELIRAYDRQIEDLCKERYPQTKAMTQVRGVGPLTALVFLLSLGNVSRFKRGRDVPAFFGLCPKQHESGSLRKELGISKAGNRFVRRLLVQSAHYMLSRNGEDCDIRHWGLALVARGGKCAKKRSAVAVARKLSVVLHRLLVDQTEYRRFRNPLATAVA